VVFKQDMRRKPWNRGFLLNISNFGWVKVYG
jgi:hypothetical protein